MTVFKDKVNLIWEVVDLLRGDYKQFDYGEVFTEKISIHQLDVSYHYHYNRYY